MQYSNHEKSPLKNLIHTRSKTAQFFLPNFFAFVLTAYSPYNETIETDTHAILRQIYVEHVFTTTI
jgi:hypothetical protein